MTLLTWIILGQFKWTVLGALLVLFALFAVWVIGRKWRYKFLRFLFGLVMVCFALWYGHLWIDPKFHAIEKWYVTPIDEPMHIVR